MTSLKTDIIGIASSLADRDWSSSVYYL